MDQEILVPLCSPSPHMAVNATNQPLTHPQLQEEVVKRYCHIVVHLYHSSTTTSVRLKLKKRDAGVFHLGPVGGSAGEFDSGDR